MRNYSIFHVLVGLVVIVGCSSESTRPMRDIGYDWWPTTSSDKGLSVEVGTGEEFGEEMHEYEEGEVPPEAWDAVDGEVCEPRCDGKECGDDGCEGSCGTCPGARCDGLMWISGMVCEGGVCTGGGSAIYCDDGNDCTIDTCDQAAGCSNTVEPGYCLIDGRCYLDGARNPANACEMCMASKNQTEWSSAADGTQCLVGSCSGLVWSAPKTCVSGQCIGGGLLEDCDDGNVCTTDACDAANGCKHTFQELFACRFEK